MEVTICSALEGKASGYIVFRVPSDYYVGDLLKRYCKEKNVPVAKDYVLCGRGNVTLDPHKTLKQEGIQDEDTLKLTQEDKNEQLFAFGSWWVIAFLAFMMGSIGITYSIYMFLFPQKLPQKYGLVIDAGSAHSQLFIFTWSKPEKKTIADIELIHGCFMHGGVADYRFHTEGLYHYFTTCINEAENLIPMSLIPQTPLILAATGGMRILRAYDPDGVNLILSSIREIFWTKTKFLVTRKDVFVASGQQEGINGWAALNYLMENFDERDSQASALDLGGASVQVTTELSKESKNWPTVNITIFNNTYRVFSKSFLCYGIEEAKHRYLYLLVRESVNNTHDNVILSPCLPEGFQMSFTSEDFYTPCIFSNDSKIFPPVNYLSRYAKKYVSGYSPDNNNYHVNSMTKKVKSRNYLLKGTSNTRLCQKKVESLFDYELCKENFVLGDCLNKNLVPHYKGELVGFSSIFHKLFPILGVSPEGSLEEFQASVLSICGKSKEAVLKMHSNISMDMLEDLCFDGMYVYTLLKEGLGITAKKWKNILFTNKVNEQNVVWAMGLMLNRTSNLSHFKSSKMDLVTFAALISVFIIFIILALLFLWFSLKLRQRGNVYQRVHLRDAEEA